MAAAACSSNFFCLRLSAHDSKLRVDPGFDYTRCVMFLETLCIVERSLTVLIFAVNIRARFQQH
jgi:hypothetical protein